MKIVYIVFLIWDVFCFLTCLISLASISSKMSDGSGETRNSSIDATLSGHRILGSQRSSFRTLKMLPLHLLTPFFLFFFLFFLEEGEEHLFRASFFMWNFLLVLFVRRNFLSCTCLCFFAFNLPFVSEYF